MTVEYRTLREEDITRALFAAFHRRQVVTRCWRRVDGQWIIREDPFIDDWSEADYATLVDCLRRTCRLGGLVLGAFAEGQLKGFVSVEAEPLGTCGQYRDMTSLHVSEECRGRGMGRALMLRACDWARTHGGQKLYISAHTAVESQNFYRAMGCVAAAEPLAAHVQAEPFDCQLECPL